MKIDQSLRSGSFDRLNVTSSSSIPASRMLIVIRQFSGTGSKVGRVLAWYKFRRSIEKDNGETCC
jgi:hypothetical protein